MNNKPTVVDADADANEMNKLHGESYGLDWVYPPTSECQDQACCARITLAILAEREACAMECEAQAEEPECAERAQYCADAIRMR